jgi:hypothetical protein
MLWYQYDNYPWEYLSKAIQGHSPGTLSIQPTHFVLRAIAGRCPQSHWRKARKATGNMKIVNIKGSLTRDFRLQAFFVNQFSPGPLISRTNFRKNSKWPQWDTQGPGRNWVMQKKPEDENLVSDSLLFYIERSSFLGNFLRIFLKVHKNENFFGSDFEFCPISLLVIHK